MQLLIGRNCAMITLIMGETLDLHVDRDCVMINLIYGETGNLCRRRVFTVTSITLMCHERFDLQQEGIL